MVTSTNVEKKTDTWSAWCKQEFTQERSSPHLTQFWEPAMAESSIKSGKKTKREEGLFSGAQSMSHKFCRKTSRKQAEVLRNTFLIKSKLKNYPCGLPYLWPPFHSKHFASQSYFRSMWGKSLHFLKVQLIISLNPLSPTLSGAEKLFSTRQAKIKVGFIIYSCSTS